MSHKTLVNGTVYEVDGGKTLIDGVAYSIDKGKTLVGGTAYEVGFDNGMRTVTITTFGYYVRHDSQYARVTINGVVYDGSETVISVPVGTVIECYVYVETTGRIEVDGNTVVSGTSGGYNYTVASDCQIGIAYAKLSSGNQSTNGYVGITTET